LERDIAPEFRIMGAIHFAHSACTEQRRDLVRTELSTYRDPGFLQKVTGKIGESAIQNLAAGILSKQRFDLLAKRRFDVVQHIKPRLMRKMVEPLDFAPIFGGHLGASFYCPVTVLREINAAAFFL